MKIKITPYPTSYTIFRRKNKRIKTGIPILSVFSLMSVIFSVSLFNDESDVSAESSPLEWR